MKKIITVLLLIFGVVSLFAQSPNDFKIDLDKGFTAIIITGYTGSETKVVIPAEMEGLPVRAIRGAFRDCTGLTSITIPNGVTAIGDGAFYGCTGLTSITIPNSVTAIGHGAFQGCTGLTSVTIPNSVKSIGSGAFADCSNITTVLLKEDPKIT